MTNHKTYNIAFLRVFLRWDLGPTTNIARLVHSMLGPTEN